MQVSQLFPWAMVLATISLTAYSQIVLKWQSASFGEVPASLVGKLAYLGAALLNPWVISGLAAAFGAAMCWILALSKLPLSLAYPFTAMTIVIVVLAGRVIFSESLSIDQMVGAILIVVGLIVMAVK